MADTMGKSLSQSRVTCHHRDLNLSDKDVLLFYSQMFLARAIDERLWALNRQGKVPLVASCQGAEAASMGVAFAAVKDGDYYLFPYYRDMALKLAAGVSPSEIMIGHFGKEGDTFNGGRQFLLQGASSKYKIIHISNVVASNLNQAVGFALGCKTLKEQTVVLVTIGDGGSSEGECHEAMNFAAIHNVPVVFICYNNGFAISVPQEKQMAIQDLSDRAAGYGFPGFAVDGTDFLKTYQAVQNAIKRARDPAGGPTFLELKIERLKPHTSDDDDRRYRTAESLQASLLQDPLVKFRNYLYEIGILTPQKEKEIQAITKIEINTATEAAESASWPNPSTLLAHLYAPQDGS